MTSQRFTIIRNHDGAHMKEYATRAEATRALAEYLIGSTYTATYSIYDQNMHCFGYISGNER